MGDMEWSQFYLKITCLVITISAVVFKIFWRRPAFRKIDPAVNFIWEGVESEKYRPFKGKKSFHSSLGIKNLSCDPESLILIENTYKEITRLKKQLAKQYSEKTLLTCTDSASDASVREFYAFLVHFLCSRYPQYFIRKGLLVHNRINGENFPKSPRNLPLKTLLFHLASNLEEDFVILQKCGPQKESNEYYLKAAVNGFPAGFSPDANLNKPILTIHQPVPEYQTRLRLSMARFFDRLTPNDIWVRFNWSIQVHGSLFNLENHHAYGDEAMRELDFNEIDFENGAHLRVERQVLTRLPSLRANIMLVRTYLTPLPQIKKEGLAEELIYAIDNLPDDLAIYKRRAEWGPAVTQYLKS